MSTLYVYENGKKYRKFEKDTRTVMFDEFHQAYDLSQDGLLLTDIHLL